MCFMCLLCLHHRRAKPYSFKMSQSVNKISYDYTEDFKKHVASELDIDTSYRLSTRDGDR